MDDILIVYENPKLKSSDSKMEVYNHRKYTLVPQSRKKRWMVLNIGLMKAINISKDQFEMSKEKWKKMGLILHQNLNNPSLINNLLS